MRNSTLYKLAKPITFRRSSCAMLTGHGSNLQNIEKSLREIYVPDGYTPELQQKCTYWLQTGDLSVFSEQELEELRIFLQNDQSGAEALIVAYDCDALDYRQLFIHNVKPHVYVAMKLFKDVWTRKMKDKGGLVEDFDIDVIDSTPIGELKKNPFWKDLDALIKDSDNWSLQERYYYLAKQTVHCVDDKTEVLTPEGWIGIAKMTIDTKIAIYDGMNISMEKPRSSFIFPYQGEMIHFEGEEVDQFVTPNHKMVYVSNGKQHVAEAAYVKTLARPNIPTSGWYNGGGLNLPDWQIKLLVAIQADGYIESDNRVRFKFAKDRKIDRLHDILIEGKKEYTFVEWCDTTTAGNIVSDFGVLCPELIKFFKDGKVWGSWLLQFSRQNLWTLIDELKHWDGTHTESFRHKREEYLSSIKQNIDWIKTICHLVNKQGTIGQQYPDSSIKMGINGRTLSIAKTKTSYEFSGFVYCPEVSTGMFLIRRNGKISITHNSANYDIQWANFQMNILEKSGGKIAISKEEAERFLMVYRGLFPEIPERNRRVQAQAEKYKLVYNIFGMPYQITDWNVSGTSMKDIFAWGPQSTVGEITRIAFTNMQEYIEDNNKQWDVLADTHDSYLVQCPLIDVRDCAKQMQTFMNQRLTSPVDGVEFNMRSECNIGFNWASFKKKTNEVGLQMPSWLNN